MIYKKVNVYRKSFKRLGDYKFQNRKRTSYLLLGFIPLFIKDEYLNGEF